jgi:glycine/D-amino acid oxidase-like deaminating enzyme/nitrite reductase/ring-hydroxylating ferredoxin subunit
MHGQHTATTPFWTTSHDFPRFAPLSRNVTTDVAIVGGGITGLTTAYQLARAGRSVVVLERGRCAAMDTGHTSAHLTMVPDARVSDLARQFGRSQAQAVLDGGLTAIDLIERVARELEIDAHFAWVPGYLHAPPGDAPASLLASLEADARVAREMAHDATFVDEVPFVKAPGVRFGGQARMHPRRYLAGLARAIVEAGGLIHEASEAGEFDAGRRAIRVGGHTVTCGDVVIATHNPIAGWSGLTGATLFQTKLALYTTYVVAGRVTKGTVNDALWWDTASPYRYLRIEPGETDDLVIYGGEDHKTGQEADTTARFERLETALADLVPGIVLTHRWSGQVVETPDGLPYIGRAADGQYCATGFGGNGLTFGTLAAMVMADAIGGRPNPWSELFDPDRKVLARGLWDYVRENVDYPYYMTRDRLVGAPDIEITGIEPGHGAIVERDGEKVAVYRDPAGRPVTLAATCTHMGCVVRWNAAERTWDCPCHGSRFAPTGQVLSGPAETPLARRE